MQGKDVSFLRGVGLDAHVDGIREITERGEAEAMNTTLQASAVVTSVFRGVVSLAILVLCASCSSAGPNVVGQYIEAIQSRNSKVIIDLTANYQQHIAYIKSQNPQALWPKLVADYSSQKSSAMFKPLNGSEVWTAKLSDDPVQTIQRMATLLPHSCKWAITETRQKEGGKTVYVTVSYPRMEDSPVVDSKRLKQTILVFTVDMSSKFVTGIEQLSNGDSYWTIPQLTSEQARIITLAEMPMVSLHPHSAPWISAQAEDGSLWLRVEMPSVENPWLAEYKAFYESRGFQLRNFKVRYGPGDPASVLPPAAWSTYRIASDNRYQVLYQLDEKTEVELLSVDAPPGADSARAKIRLTHNGCTPVCAMLREYWRQEFNKHIVGTFDSFFLVHWEGEKDQRGTAGGEWPGQEDRTITLRWNPADLSWHLSR